ncbi:hypothetical protein CHS0354_034990 [Potamilus streckersoni]|uniref:CS domain-containing protein n=1 Tax=Potamilus streckersoni TaxID=2493646 RepID=A0AAE0VUY6_9BIVA|nr:hypothetical protein CHS0354_034990 [Potamilus streckersoni]
MAAGVPERDFDDVIPSDASKNRVLLEVKLPPFRRTDNVNCYFTPGGLKIQANVGGKVYSKIFKDLTEENVELSGDIEPSNGSFKVFLRKKKPFSVNRS